MSESVWLERAGGDVPWGFRLHGGRDFHVPLTVQKVRSHDNIIIFASVISSLVEQKHREMTRTSQTIIVTFLISDKAIMNERDYESSSQTIFTKAFYGLPLWQQWNQLIDI